ncbi:MAG TPA: type II toxin-antitoxin system VapC family toxin [Bryobacteraceae bacterium]
MIILDTNVVSALMDPEPVPQVVQWLDAQQRDSIWTTSITIFELQFGLAILSEGRKRHLLELEFRRLIEDDLGNRVLEFDSDAASLAAFLAAERQLRGRRGEIQDTQIAGVVLSRRATLATRNVRHFADIEARVVNPWDA